MIPELSEDERRIRNLKDEEGRTIAGIATLLNMTPRRVIAVCAKARRKRAALSAVKRFMKDGRKLEAAMEELWYFMPFLRPELERRYNGWMTPDAAPSNRELGFFLLNIKQEEFSRAWHEVKGIGPVKARRINEIISQYGLRLGMINAEIDEFILKG